MAAFGHERSVKLVARQDISHCRRMDYSDVNIQYFDLAVCLNCLLCVHLNRSLAASTRLKFWLRLLQRPKPSLNL